MKILSFKRTPPGKVRRVATVAYICLLLTFLVFVLHRRFAIHDLSNPMGNQKPISENFKFAVIGDSHSYYKPLKTALTKAVKKDCSFVVHTGDFVTRDSDIDYSMFMHKISRFLPDIRIYLAKGNHETYSPDGGFSTVYDQYVQKSNLSFSKNNVHFLILDSSRKALGHEGITYLKNYLKNIDNHKETTVFVFMHFPPSYCTLRSDLPAAESDLIVRLLEQGEIDYLIAGHYHNKQVFEINDSYLIINGSGGGSFSYPSGETNYLEFEVKDNTVTYKFINTDRDMYYCALLIYILTIYIPEHAGISCLIIIGIIIRELFSLRPVKNA